VTGTTAVGVFGVGHMGAHHARVLSELPEADLVGVHDADADRAAAVATEHDTRVLDADALIERADALSVAVPTRYHHDVASRAIEAGVDVLVEKPFVETPAEAHDLIDRANRTGVTLQVGHVERFNPAVRALADVLPDLSVIAVDARRLGPPVDRDGTTGVTRDLMIHDVDVLRSVVDAEVVGVDAVGTREGGYVSALLRFGNGVVATLQASRVTQQKVRTLSVTADDARVNLDYIDQSVRVHRHSLPEYVEADGEVRYRHESVIEQPTVGNGEPLTAELAGFLRAAREGTAPRVTGEDGLRALELAWRIEDALGADPPVGRVSQ
jgi:predicted dehydrogenase